MKKKKVKKERKKKIGEITLISRRYRKQYMLYIIIINNRNTHTSVHDEDGKHTCVVFTYNATCDGKGS